MGLAHFLALVVPTFLMGMSLPFLVRAMVRDSATASRTIGVLYGINVLGASAGALVTPWLLIRFQGMEGAVLWGVAGNTLAGLVALAAGVRRGLGGSRASDERGPRGIPFGSRGARGRVVPGFVDGSLRPFGLRRAVPRDPLVQAHRRVGEEHRLHLRHRAQHLPAGPRRGQPAGRLEGRALPPPAARLPDHPVRPSGLFDAGGGRPGPPAQGRARLSLVLRLLGARLVLPARGGLEPRRACSVSTRSCPSPSTALRPCSWASPSRRSSARSRTTRARAGARWAFCRRPTSAAAWRAACWWASSSSDRLGTTGSLRLLLVLGPRPSSAVLAWHAGPRAALPWGGGFGRGLRGPARPEGALDPPARRERRPPAVFHRRGRDRGQRDHPRPARTLAGHGQRPPPQLGPLRGAAHAAGRGARARPPGAGIEWR